MVVEESSKKWLGDQDADGHSLLNCPSAGGLPKGHAYGGKLEWASNSTITIKAPLEFRSEDDTTDIIKGSGDLTLDITASGANGLDTGSEASDTWYYVWLIYNPTTDTVAGLLSTSSTAPTLPSGYTKKRRIGVVRNNDSSNFWNFEQIGTDKLREYLWVADFEDLVVLSGGTASSWTAVSCAKLIPPTSTYGIFFMRDSNDSGFSYYRPTDSGLTDGPYLMAYGYPQSLMLMPTNASQQIDYQGSFCSINIRVQGFKEEI